MRTYTLDQLKTICLQRADMQNSTFIDTTSGGELENLINSSVAELHDLLCTTYEDYFLTCRVIPINGQQDVYDLPNDFFKEWRVEVDRVGNFTQPIKLRRFMGPEWVRNSSSVVVGATGLLAARYRILGNNIFLSPKPSSGGFMRLWYYPPAKKLTNAARTFSDSAVNLSTDAINFQAHGYSAGDRWSATSSGTLPTPLVSGTNYYVLPTDKDNYQLAITAQNSFDGTPIDLTALNGGTHTISDDLGIYDGQNGWEEYVLCDVAAKLLEKEQNDPSPLLKRKGELEQRIRASAKARDIGESQRIVDVSRHDFFPDFFYGKFL